MTSRNNPIKVELVNKGEFRISLKFNDWELSQIVSESVLKEIQEQINNATGLTRISESFSCSGDDSKKIKEFWESRGNWDRCKECKFKWKECLNCVVKCESPLERDLLLELRKNDIIPVLQRRFNKDGTFYEFPIPLDFDNILTIPDFYIEGNNSKLCVYADGHTYHERTENQALRDRNIDRELQRIGFTVLRYTGQEIRKNCALVVENIKSNL